MLQVLEAFALVLHCWMMFGEVVRSIVVCFTPVDTEVAVADAVTDQVEAHIEGFGAELLDSIIGNACCVIVAGINYCWRLRVLKCEKSCSDGGSLFSIEE